MKTFILRGLVPLILSLSVSTAAIAGLILPVDTDVAGFVGMAAQGPLDSPTYITSMGEFITVFGSSTAGLANPYLVPSVAAFFANGGARIVVVRVAGDDDLAVIGTDGGPGARTGLQALLDADEVSIVAAPGMVSPSVQAALIAHCQGVGDRMAILDPAVPDDLEEILAQRAGLGSDDGFAALYFPWVQAAPTGTSLLLPPSGFVAGWYAASDPHESPVGVLATATGVAHDVTNAEQEILNPQGINAIRNISGIRIWGARTLATNPEWTYVSTRRMGICLEESIVEGTAWALFEPNDASLWSTLNNDVAVFLEYRWLDGWFQGATFNEAYFVQCWLGSTMTQEDIDQGRTVLQYGFAPVRPAEFLVGEVVHDRSVLSGIPRAQATVMTLHPAEPNPFNPTTSLRFRLEAEQGVSLEIFDVAGRLVDTVLSDRLLEKGEHRFRWDGRNDRDRAAASGVYLVRLRSEEAEETRRILLAR